MNRGSGAGSRELTDNNNVWGEAGDDPRAAAGVDAQFGAATTYDFYKDVLGRDSIDGRGEKLVNNVHINQNYVNAFWDGSQMNYGDGDGVDASVLTTLDVAGHEITHGLTERTAGLIYSGESGGLNEAMSDILGGAGVEWYALQKNPELEGKLDPYKVGEQAWTPGTPGDALRYMDDPTKDNYSIDNYKNYPKQTEVHGSSGIANNAFYLLTHGGTNKTSGVEVTDAIGMEKGLKIFGRALTTYMTPSTTFAQAREACIQAASDLYGADSVEVQKVKDSWHAVGVG
jgi:Zn-dependent metalloprotease